MIIFLLIIIAIAIIFGGEAAIEIVAGIIQLAFFIVMGGAALIAIAAVIASLS